MADRASAVPLLIAQFDDLLNRVSLYGPADALRDTWQRLKAALLAADPVQGAPPDDLDARRRTDDEGWFRRQAQRTAEDIKAMPDWLRTPDAESASLPPAAVPLKNREWVPRDAIGVLARATVHQIEKATEHPPFVDLVSNHVERIVYNALVAALALPSRVVPPNSGTVADVRAALGESLSNELAEAVLDKSNEHETRSPDGDGQDAFAGGVDRGRAICSPQPLRPAGSEPAESHTTSDLDRLLRQARSASEGTTRRINDLGAAIERARETRPHADWLKETDERINLLPRVKHEGSDYISLTAVLLMIRRDSYSAAAGGSPHAPQPPPDPSEPPFAPSLSGDEIYAITQLLEIYTHPFVTGLQTRLSQQKRSATISGATVTAVQDVEDQHLAASERRQLRTVDERDRFHEWADKLAYALFSIEDIGEHSNRNNPWANALERLEALAAAHQAIPAPPPAWKVEADRVEVWMCMNRMENCTTFEERRKHRTRLEQLLGIPTLDAPVSTPDASKEPQ